jgi:hypothetical protein
MSFNSMETTAMTTNPPPPQNTKPPILTARHPERSEGSHLPTGDSSSHAPQNDSSKPHDQIKALCGLLAESIDCPAGDTGVLQDQTQILNALFHATLAAHLDLTPTSSEYTESRRQGWIKLALQIQKQCMDTAKAERAGAYLNSLIEINHTNGRKNMLPHPLPQILSERSEQSE